MEYVVGETNATLLQASRSFTPSDYDTKAYAPINKNNVANRFTGMQVQNVSAGNVDITVTYTGSSGPCAGNTYVDTELAVPTGNSVNFPSNFLPAGCFASAAIVATGNIVAVVNEAFVIGFTNSAGKNEATSYNCIPDNQKTTIISVPLYKEDSFSKQSGIAIQNITAVNATNVIITFRGPTGTYTSNPQTILAGSSLVIQNARFFAAGFWNGTALTPAVMGCTESLNACGVNGQFAVIITADQQVVAIVNESTYPNLTPRFNQDKINYEGFNLVTAP